MYHDQGSDYTPEPVEPLPAAAPEAGAQFRRDPSATGAVVDGEAAGESGPVPVRHDQAPAEAADAVAVVPPGVTDPPPGGLAHPGRYFAADGVVTDEAAEALPDPGLRPDPDPAA